MKLKLRDKQIYLEETLIVITFLCILSSRAKTFLSNYFICYLFIVFHEAAHILTASIFGYELRKINIRLAGLNAVFKEEFNGIKGIFIYLAGPLSNIVLALMFNNIKMVFEINIALALINIVPIYPLDGYNILKLIISSCASKIKTKKLINTIQKNSEIILMILSIFMCFKCYNFSLFLLLVYIKTNSLQPLKSL